jgi:P27 family predicted phage terminase small subunit
MKLKSPPAPKHLNEAARAAWKMFCVQIGDVKLSDLAALETLSVAFATMRAAQAKLDVEGEVIKMPNEYLGLHPLSRTRKEARQIVVTLCRQFHLTPASRDAAETVPDSAFHELPDLDNLPD